MQHSSTERFLKGKTIDALPGPVSSVVKWGKNRIVKDTMGNKVVLPKRQMLREFHWTLSRIQKGQALNSIRRLSDGKASVKIGGAEKGERKVYASESGAKQAITRRYGKY